MSLWNYYLMLVFVSAPVIVYNFGIKAANND